MTKLRQNLNEYVGNSMFQDSATAGVRYCFGHKKHLRSLGGRTMGRLRMFYCAECVQARTTKKGES